MANLLSSAEVVEIREIFNDIHETFSRQLIVYKEPLKSLNSPTSSINFVYGFGDSQGQDKYTYSEVTGVYPCTVRYGPQNLALNSELNSYIADGEVVIKVQENCKNFIESGKTEKLMLDNRTFILEGEASNTTFLPSGIYLFKLSATK